MGDSMTEEEEMVLQAFLVPPPGLRVAGLTEVVEFVNGKKFIVENTGGSAEAGKWIGSKSILYVKWEST